MSHNDTVRTDEIQGDIVHVYGDIEEADNKLPNWWLWSFYATIGFSVVYWMAYQAFGWASLPIETYVQAKLEAMNTGGPVTTGELEELASDQLAVEGGRALFVANCASCHQANASGQIGPNLTDAYWLHGGSPTDIFTTIRDGVVSKGMPAWGLTLGVARSKQLAAYVLTIQDTDVPGKAPEGEKWTPSDEPADASAPLPTGEALLDGSLPSE